MSGRTRNIWFWLIPVAVLAAGIFYYFADPKASLIMPKCILKELTGWDCPSCGVQRAIHALLHGHIAEAFSYNFFFAIAVPLLLLTAYATIMIKRPKPSAATIKLYNFVTSRYTLLSYVALFFLWWIIRNLL